MKPLLNKYSWLLVFLIPLMVYCKKPEKPVVLSNLQLLVELKNDGSGLVLVTATADQADRYYFSFGISDNEEAVRTTDGKASFTYTASGAYVVKVTAYGPNNSSAVVTKNINVVVANGDAGYVTPESYPGMKLSWKDEFNGTSLNTADWTAEIGNGTDGWGNAELQYYRKENASVADGYLTITAKKEALGGSQYTSSRLKTQYNKSFKYGRIDVRAKLPKGQGIWPAIWMLGANIDDKKWPYSGEIDIMELVGGGPGKDDTVYGTIHYDNEGTYAHVTKSYVSPKGDFSEKFHVFSLVWDETKLVWLVDDVAFYTQDITAATFNEFHEPFFLLLNVAVGGRWPGSPDSSTSFPQKMMVDYVRVFQKQ